MLDRIRRVKCDENKSACRQCTLTGRKCDGYVTSNSRRSIVKWTTPATTLSIAMSSYRDNMKRTLELHCLDAFRHKIVASVSDDSSRRLERLILQCLHQKPCVPHAAVAFTAHQLQTMSQWPGSTAEGLRMVVGVVSMCQARTTTFLDQSLNCNLIANWN